MLQGRLTQKLVASKLSVKFVRYGAAWRLYKNEKRNKGGRGRKLSVPNPTKMIITKSIGKTGNLIGNSIVS